MYGERGDGQHDGEEDVNPSNVYIDNKGHELNISLKDKIVSDNLSSVGAGIWLQSSDYKPLNLTIDADKINISSETKKRADAVRLVGSKDNEVSLTINGNTNILAVGDRRAEGLFATGNSTITINGDLKMRDEDNYGVRVTGKTDTSGESQYLSVSGIYTGDNLISEADESSKIIVNGNVDLAVDGSGVVLNYNGTVNLNGGGTIEVNAENDYSYAVRNEGGTFTMNVDENGDPLTGNDVTIKGNILTLPYSQTGSPSFAPTVPGGKGETTIALNTANSVLQGMVAASPQSNTTLYVQNGATWINEDFSKMPSSYQYSMVSNFVGGSDKDHLGYIVQKTDGPLRITNYSGYSTIVYDHNNTGLSKSDYIGGDTYIQNAADNSFVRLVTNTNGIENLHDNATVGKVLNALAQKIYYAGKDDGKLSGEVGIASGLTSSDALLAFTNMKFTGNNGQGVSTGDVVYTEDSYQETTDFTTKLTGDPEKDVEYSASGVLREDGSYVFSKDSTITITPSADIPSNDDIWRPEFAKNNYNDTFAAGVALTDKELTIDTGSKQLTIISDDTNHRGHVFGVLVEGKDSDVTINSENLSFELNTVQGNKSVNGITVIDNAELTLNGTTTMNLAGSSVYGLHVLAGGNVTVDNLTINSADAKHYTEYSRSFGIIAGADNFRSKLDGLSTVTVNGKYTFNANGNAVGVEDGNTVNLNGDVDINVNKDNKSGYAALRLGGNGYLNVNVNADSEGIVTGVNDNKVVIHGNLIAEKDNQNANSVINLALTNDESELHGVADTTYYYGTSIVPHDYAGEINLYLNNGASWYNEEWGKAESKVSRGEWQFVGSNITNYTGGNSQKDAGNIFQYDSNDLTLNNYKGYTNIFYEHKGTGDSVNDYGAGDTHVTTAAEGSHITLVTDTAGGIEAGNKDVVESVFAALAQKLYYDNAANNTNLTGAVAIASGLTSSSAFKALGDMSFDAENGGKGQYVEDTYTTDTEIPVVPDYDYSDKIITGDQWNDLIWIDRSEGVEYTTEDGKIIYNFDGNSTLNGIDLGVSRELKNVEINVNDGNGTLIFNRDKTAINISNGDNVVINGDLDITANGPTGGQNVGTSGISVNRDGTSEGNMENDTTHLTVNGDVKIKVSGQYNGGAAEDYNGARWASTGIRLGMSAGSTIDINGDVDIAVDGTGVVTDPYYLSPVTDNPYELATINLNGGDVNIVTSETNERSYYSLASYGGTVNVNATENGIVDESHIVKLQGNVIAMKNTGNWDVPQGGNFFFQDGRINIGLANDESSWSGVIDNSGKDQAGEVNVFLQNGAVWNHKAMSLTNGMDVEHMPSPSSEVYGTYDGISHVNRLVGGSSAENAGHIYAVDKADIEIDVYKGYTSVFYEHLNDGDEAGDYKAGDIIINHAVSGSGIELVTDSDGITEGSLESYENTMDALAQKLTYKGWAEGEDGLIANVKIASGLTSSSAEAEGYIAYDDTTGEGYFTTEKPENITGENGYKDEGGTTPGGGDDDKPSGDITYGSDESPIMQGVRSAMMTGMLAWRDTAADISNRGEAMRRGEEGIWAKAQGGKSKYDSANTNIENSYWAAQVGYDREMKHGWHLGAMVDYLDGDANYLLGGKGDNKLYSFGVYGSKDLGNNDYVDIGVKFGNIENDYTVYNELGRELTGNYDARGYSISAQYGKRFGDDAGYWEPQVQFTWAHVEGTDDTAYSGKDALSIHQDDFDSLVGRIGVEAGKKMERSSLYARLSLAHEFAGDVDGTYYAKDGGLKATSYDLGDTWSELTVGGTHKIGKDCDVYADFTRSLSGDYQHQWKLNAGLRFTF